MPDKAPHFWNIYMAYKLKIHPQLLQQCVSASRKSYLGKITTKTQSHQENCLKIDLETDFIIVFQEDDNFEYNIVTVKK